MARQRNATARRSCNNDEHLTNLCTELKSPHYHSNATQCSNFLHCKAGCCLCNTKDPQLNDDDSYIYNTDFQNHRLILDVFSKNSQFGRDDCLTFDFYDVFNQCLIAVKIPNFCEMKGRCLTLAKKMGMKRTPCQNFRVP